MNDYNNNYPSVTSVLGDVLRKKGLEFWFKFNTAESCDAESNKGKTIGTLIHKVIQLHIEKTKIDIETEYPDEVKNCLKGFFKFRKDYPKIKLKKTEVKLTSEEYKFNGTLDCLGIEGKELILIDWKTAKCYVGTKKEVDIPKIYPEHMYQASAYVKAHNENMNIDIERAYVLGIAKDKVAYNLSPLCKNAIEEMFSEVFLPALKIYNYQEKEDSYNGRKARQRTGSDSKTGRGCSRPCNKLPASF